MRYAAFALVLVLSGCSDRLVDEPLVPLPNTPPSENAVPRSYVKGPNTLPLGGRASFRSEAVPGAVRYEWRVSRGSEDAVALPNVSARQIEIQAVGLAAIELEVQAQSERGLVLSIGRKAITVVR